MAQLTTSSERRGRRVIGVSWDAIKRLSTRVVQPFRRAEPPGPPPEPDLLVAKRGESREYYFYLDLYARANGMKVVEDRRVGPRRQEEPARTFPERRRSDRRGPLPPTWSEVNALRIHGTGEGDKPRDDDRQREGAPAMEQVHRERTR